MKISVGCHSRSGGSEPTSLCLGSCCLLVTKVQQRAEQPEATTYEVRVLDGRRFVVRRQVEVDQWELVAVYDRAPQQVRSSRFKTALSMLLLISYALAGKSLQLARRALKCRSHAQHLPNGGATA